MHAWVCASQVLLVPRQVCEVMPLQDATVPATQASWVALQVAGAVQTPTCPVPQAPAT